jgi:type VI secretion system protein ImpA
MVVEGLDLLQPIEAGRPCGESLEDTQLMASLDAYQLFGQPVSLDPALPWTEIRQRALEALAVSKDLRALAHLGAASLRIDGLPGFFLTLDAASSWLEQYWDFVYPVMDEDALMRRNAISAFADAFAVIDPLRRIPVVSSRQHGRFSLRDMDIATGNLQPAEGEEPPDQLRIDAAFDSAPGEDLASLHEAVSRAMNAVRSIEARMRAEAGSEGSPGLDRLLAQLTRMEAVLKAHMAQGLQSGATTDEQERVEGSAEAARAAAVGAIRSRQDAVRALESVAEYFRRNEPSSPIPMLLTRAERLVSKSFLEVLADLAPEGVPQARAAGGIRDEE